MFSDMSIVISLGSYLDLNPLASSWLFLLTSLLLLVIVVIKEVNLDAKRIADPVDTCPMRTHNTRNEFSPDLEFGGLGSINETRQSDNRQIDSENGCTDIAVDNLVVLGSLDDLLDLLDGTVNIGANTANDDDVLGGRITSIRTELDGQSFVLTDDAVSRKSGKSEVKKRGKEWHVYVRVKSRAPVTNDSLVPFLFDHDGLRFNVRSSLCHL